MRPWRDTAKKTPKNRLLLLGKREGQTSAAPHRKQRLTCEDRTCQGAKSVAAQPGGTGARATWNFAKDGKRMR
jgi:hypothetical protein